MDEGQRRFQERKQKTTDRSALAVLVISAAAAFLAGFSLFRVAKLALRL